MSHKLASFSLACVFHCCWISKLELQFSHFTAIGTHSGFPPENWWVEVEVVTPPPPPSTKSVSFSSLQRDNTEGSPHLANYTEPGWNQPVVTGRPDGHADKNEPRRSQQSPTISLPVRHSYPDTSAIMLPSSHQRHMAQVVLQAHHAGPTCQIEVWCFYLWMWYGSQIKRATVSVCETNWAKLLQIISAGCNVAILTLCFIQVVMW